MVEVVEPKLFIKKLVIIFSATILLIPLIHYKLLLPAGIYLSFLLALHIIFVIIYFRRVPWRDFRANRTTFILRITAVIFFAYLLAALKYVGSPTAIILNLSAALGIHIIILMCLMIKLVASPLEA